jgi:CubicO group peptidase (beta-lactamase class C family)
MISRVLPHAAPPWRGSRRAPQRAHPGAPHGRAHDDGSHHQRAEGRLALFPGFWDNRGWGFGAAIVTRRDDIAASPGSYAWMGGFGTSFIVDPAEDMVAIFLVRRLMSGPSDAGLNQDYFTLAYQAIDD